MKNIIKTTAIAALACMAACTSPEMGKVQTLEKENDFKQTIDLVCEQMEVPAIISIREWQIQDSLLLCQSDDTDYFYYRFRLSDFALVDSFITKGQGPGEFIFPTMARSENDEWLALNRGKREFVKMKGKEMIKEIPYKRYENITDMKTYRYPLVGYMNFFPREVTWKLFDVETNTVKDSILYMDETNKGQALQQHDFKWDFGADNRVVLAFRNRDEYTVAKLQADTIANIKIYHGTESTASGAYYTDVQCSDKYIFLLSGKHDASTMESDEHSSEIEVFDYEGNAVCLLKLDYAASNMLLDKKNSRFLFTSYSDDDIHFAPIPDFLKD